mmetsp:Transcript_7573/g.17423  ORF Transcript_7573/g.17423 Transcript_7573/m.17423 type:complete len:82 (-) Transcript_7573:21-266(-)
MLRLKAYQDETASSHDTPQEQWTKWVAKNEPVPVEFVSGLGTGACDSPPMATASRIKTLPSHRQAMASGRSRGEREDASRC